MTRLRSLLAALFVAGMVLVLTPSASSAQILAEIFGPQRSHFVSNTTYYGPAVAVYYGSTFPGYGYNGWYYPNTRYPNIGFEGYGPPPVSLAAPIAPSAPTNLEQRMGYYGSAQRSDSANPSGSTGYAYGNPSEGKKNRAVLNVSVPTSDTELWIEGVKIQRIGTQREFLSPILDPESRFSYEIKARWSEDGREVTRTKIVSVRANTPTQVDFTKADPTSSTKK